MSPRRVQHHAAADHLGARVLDPELVHTAAIHVAGVMTVVHALVEEDMAQAVLAELRSLADGACRGLRLGAIAPTHITAGRLLCEVGHSGPFHVVTAAAAAPTSNTSRWTGPCRVLATGDQSTACAMSARSASDDAAASICTSTRISSKPTGPGS